MTATLLCGAFGQSNPGDDALLDAFARVLADRELLVPVTGSPSLDLSPDGPPTGGRPVSGRGRYIPPTAASVARSLRVADAVVVAGGTVFKLLHPSARRHPLGLLARTAALQAGARARGIPFALVGVGAGDLRGSTARRLVRRIADHADLLVLRDEESAAVLRDAGATGPFRVAADPAWSLLAAPASAATPGPDPQRSQPVLVAISHLADRDPVRLSDRIAALVDHHTGRGVEVHLQPWQGGVEAADVQLALSVRNRARLPRMVHVRSRPADLHDAVASCADARAVVGLRFHSLVAAAAAGRPFLAIAHEPKLAGLARRLGQVSVPPHAAPAVLCEAADQAMRTAPADRSLVDREIELAHHSLRLLRVVLSRGAEDELLDEGRTELTPGVSW